jgi:hypothetical protein
MGDDVGCHQLAERCHVGRKGRRNSEQRPLALGQGARLAGIYLTVRDLDNVDVGLPLGFRPALQRVY